jgi:hypothetical protein
MGSLAQTKSYLDDTNVILPYRDLSWFIHTFAERGAPLGIYLNPTKTKILTSLTPISPICNTNITTKDTQSLCEALAKLGSNSELLEGTCFLGQPLGNSSYAARLFDSKANTPLHHPVSSSDCTTPKHSAPFTRIVHRLRPPTSSRVTCISTFTFSHLPPPSLDPPFHKSSLPSMPAQHPISVTPSCPCFHSLLSGMRRRSRCPDREIQEPNPSKWDGLSKSYV